MLLWKRWRLSAHTTAGQWTLPRRPCDATVWTASARRYRVKGYPTLKVLHNGQVYNYDGVRSAPL